MVGLTEEDFGTLQEAHVKQFSEHFKTPEMFMRMNGKLVVLPMENLDEANRPSISEQIHGAKGKGNRDRQEKVSGKIDEMER